MAAAPVQVQREDKCRFRPHGWRWEDETTGLEGEHEVVIGGLGEAGETLSQARKQGAFQHSVKPTPKTAVSTP